MHEAVRRPLILITDVSWCSVRKAHGLGGLFALRHGRYSSATGPTRNFEELSCRVQKNFFQNVLWAREYVNAYFENEIRELADMMSAKFLDLFLPPCPPLDLIYTIKLTRPPYVRLLFHDPWMRTSYLEAP